MKYTRTIIISIVIFLIIYLTIYIASVRKPDEIKPVPVLLFEYEDNIPPRYEKSRAWSSYKKAANFMASFHGIKNNKTYCDQVKEYRKKYPIELDERGLPVDRVIYSNYPSFFFVKKTLDSLYSLVLPDYVHYDDIVLPEVDLPLNITMFFIMTHFFHNRIEIDTSFVCEGQRYSHIPGNSYMDDKMNMMLDLKKYSNYYTGREHCFDFKKTVPYTLILDNIEEVQEFISSVKENRNDPTIKWILKKAYGSNKGEGVYIVDQKLASGLLNTDFSTLKGYVAQRYVSEPFLINNRKFDIRSYLFIANLDPLILLYHNGFLKLSIEEFDGQSSNDWIHVTNVGKAKQHFKKNNFTKAEVEKNLEETGWMFSQFQEYLEEQHIDYDALIREIKRISFHLVRVNLHRMPRHPRLFEIFGLDFILDKDLNVILLENNFDPGIVGSNQEKIKMNTKLLEDIVEIEYALEYNPSVFDEILENSGFEWIFDGRKKGIERYHGLFTADCL